MLCHRKYLAPLTSNTVPVQYKSPALSGKNTAPFKCHRFSDEPSIRETVPTNTWYESHILFVEDICLSGPNVVLCSKSVPTFRKTLLPPSLRRIHIDADKSTLWKVGTFLSTTWHLIPEYSKDWMGDYGEVRWMECVMFRGYVNGTSFVGLPGYMQWDSTCAFQDMRNGTYFVGLSGYTQRDLLRGPTRIYATGVTSWALQDIRNMIYFVGLSGYKQWDFGVRLSGYAQWNSLRGPSRIYATGLTSCGFQDMRNGTYFVGLSGYARLDFVRGHFRNTHRHLFPRSDYNKKKKEPSFHSTTKKETGKIQ